jgi:hypothetical protein
MQAEIMYAETEISGQTAQNRQTTSIPKLKAKSNYGFKLLIAAHSSFISTSVRRNG